MTFARPAVIDEALHGACNLKAMIFIPLIASVFITAAVGLSIWRYTPHSRIIHARDIYSGNHQKYRSVANI